MVQNDPRAWDRMIKKKEIEKCSFLELFWVFRRFLFLCGHLAIWPILAHMRIIRGRALRDGAK